MTTENIIARLDYYTSIDKEITKENSNDFVIYRYKKMSIKIKSALDENNYLSVDLSTDENGKGFEIFYVLVDMIKSVSFKYDSFGVVLHCQTWFDVPYSIL